MLLQREDVDPNQPDAKYGLAPLSWAAEEGHEGMVKMLLAREDIDPNQAYPFDCQMPLSLAAKSGHEGS